MFLILECFFDLIESTKINIVEVNIEALVLECVKFHALPIDVIIYSSNLQAWPQTKFQICLFCFFNRPSFFNFEDLESLGKKKFYFSHIDNNNFNIHSLQQACNMF